jgi:hypothetical protein
LAIKKKDPSLCHAPLGPDANPCLRTQQKEQSYNYVSWAKSPSHFHCIARFMLDIFYLDPELFAFGWKPLFHPTESGNDGGRNPNKIKTA